MARTYSDAEKILASELAYLDFDGYEDQDLGTIVKEIQDAYNNTPNPDKKLQTQKQLVEDILEKVGRNDVNNWENWTIKKVCNDNGPSGSGYYGLLIETQKGEAIVASRGSEKKLDQLIPDWVSNDAGFLDGDGTSQEKVAKKFMEEIWYEHGQEYDGFTVTGHSLGGHLALHMAITAPAAMKRKIDNATSYDGPGFSDEYIKNHRGDIDKMATKMTHYKYSIVGGLLFPLPGVGVKIIESNANGFWDIFNRHSLSTLVLDEHGNVVSGGERIESIIAGKLTRMIDGLDRGDWEVLAILFELDLRGLTPRVIFGLTVLLVKSLAEVFNLAKETIDKVGKWIEDVKYKYFKPQVSGNYEISTAGIKEASANLTATLRDSLNEAQEALAIVNSMRSTWTSCAFLRSKIRSNVRSIENDIAKLSLLNTIVSEASDMYTISDNSVAGLFA